MTWTASDGEITLRYATFMGETYYFDSLDTADPVETRDN
ncbi:Uncharacterised protein [Mycobacteroides abscessus subsp. abscessus]|nr:Uncharacterised protein [Mycobacteroides abscessus subsp. abscessus]SHW17205.1 Uncharacterised protein [Mycobacteroides abscessus subsp. abscessus]SIH83303.1 Uncharacterised protein [Mycobacteroides abscessus subsp. abscessus]SII51159.1 Uncharacterised protein [Mycobacteroides abscessus subsp. abscessus]SII80119.1 Uncharacterised protein [Mycobacteroides abscessus subsp. abscessus]